MDRSFEGLYRKRGIGVPVESWMLARCFGGKARVVVLKTDLPLRRKNLSVVEVLQSRFSVAHLQSRPTKSVNLLERREIEH